MFTLVRATLPLTLTSHHRALTQFSRHALDFTASSSSSLSPISYLNPVEAASASIRALAIKATPASIRGLLEKPPPPQLHRSSAPTNIDADELALENIVNAVFYGSNEFAMANTEVQIAVYRIFEGLLQQLLSLKWTEPALVEVPGYYLNAMGPFLKYFPDAVRSKLLFLLSSRLYYLPWWKPSVLFSLVEAICGIGDLLMAKALSGVNDGH